MFDLTKKIESSNDPLVEGYYQVVVEKAEWKSSKNNPQNEYVNLKYKVTGEESRNRVFFSMLNLINSNETARNIAMSELQNMCLAMGAKMEQLNLTKDQIIPAILDRPMIVKLAIKEDSYGKKNVIREYREIAPKQTAPVSMDSIPF